METNDVGEFRHYILNGEWEHAEASLYALGVTDEESLRVSVHYNMVFTT